MKRHLFTALLLGLALSVPASEVTASHVFALVGVTFDDGGTATGTFTTDDGLGVLLDYDIVTSLGSGIGFEYTPLTSSSSSTALPFILVLNTPPALDNILQLTFTGLTASGAPITLGTNDSFEQTLSARREVVAGEVVAVAAVPEPSTLALVGVGAFALVGYRHRRRKA
jgi:PEP-CTERM motif